MANYLENTEDDIEVESKIPDAETFFLKTHLYEEFSFDIKNNKDYVRLIDLEFFNDAIHCYCPQCKQDRTFRNDRIKSLDVNTNTHIHNPANMQTPYNFKHYGSQSWREEYLSFNKTYTLEFYCTHNHAHRIYFTFTIHNMTIQKIGQFPTILDLENNTELNEYKKELGIDKGREFHKAIGLASHSVGVGSFVYLRRIFEDFIFQAKNKAIEDKAITEDDFIPKRMDEKIELLSNYLPHTLVEHKEYYSVVSKGIHELTEDECLKYFNTLKMGIEVILDEKIEARKKEEKRKTFQKSLGDIHQEVKAKADK